MIHTAFFDVSRQTAHAAINGSQPPALGGKLLTHLKIIAKCFVGDEVIEIDEGTAEFLILAKTDPAGTASLIDSTAVLNTSDPDEPQYEFEWNPADSVQLRAVLDAAADPTAPVELRYEFRFERAGEKVCIGGPIWFLNNFFRPETPAPEATLNTSWETLKSRVLPGANLTRTVDDAAKTLTFAGEDSEANAAAIAAETTARQAADTAQATALAAHTGNLGNPHAVTKAQVGLENVDNTSDANKPVSTAQQAALDAKAASAHTHTQADVTGLVADLAAKAATNQKLDDFGVPDDNSDLNATIARHGLLPKLGGGQANFLRADGTWAAPAGGGSNLVCGSGTVQGNDSGHPALAPAELTVEFQSFSQEGTMQFNFNGSDYFVQFSATDLGVSSPTFWADTSWAMSVDDLASVCYSALSGNIPDITVGSSGPVFTAYNAAVGSTAHSAYVASPFAVNINGGGYGQDEAASGGGINYATLLPAVAGKTHQVIRVGCYGIGNNPRVKIQLGVNVLGTFSENVSQAELLITALNWVAWSNASYDSLIAVLVDEYGEPIAPENMPIGGSLTIWCMALQK